MQRHAVEAAQLRAGPARDEDVVVIEHLGVARAVDVNDRPGAEHDRGLVDDPHVPCLEVADTAYWLAGFAAFEELGEFLFGGQLFAGLERRASEQSSGGDSDCNLAHPASPWL